MKRLSKEQILMLHSQLIEQTGGIDGVNVMGLLIILMPQTAVPDAAFQGNIFVAVFPKRKVRV